MLYYKLNESVFAALKDKKSCHDDIEGKSAFQTIAIEIYKQQQQQQQNKIKNKKTPKIINKLCYGKCGCQN